MPRAAALPASLPPRILRPQRVAAEYVGIGEGTFRKLVAEGTLPAPIRFGTRCKGWDRLALDRAIEKMGGAPTEANPWDSTL